jgi:type IV secretory pathway TraG/TraD family ATPase VirD4
MRKNLPAMQSEVAPQEEVAGDRLGTARWLPVEEARRLLAFCPPPGERKRDGPSAQIWIGQSFPYAAEPLAFAEDERHVLLVAGTRGGKGTSSIIPTLCHWPGSCIVVDPKGENAAVTARRRYRGSEYARGLGQSVYVLDPFGEVATLPPALRASFNPLDAIDPGSDLAVDDAARIAAALVVPTGSHEPFWEDWARSLVKGLILYVLVDVAFEGKRNLTSVWRLLNQGAWQLYEKLQAHFERLSPEERKPLPSPFDLLWKDMTT